MAVKEVKRKVLHLLLGVILAAAIYYDIIGWLSLFVAVLLSVLLSYVTKHKRFFAENWLLRNFEREEDIKIFPYKGLTFYLIGALIAVFLFEKDIALASIAILCLGDSISRLVGEAFGKIKHPLDGRKFVEGAFAGFFAGIFGAVLFIPWYEAVIASFFAMAAEGLELKVGMADVDDNLVVPIAAGFAVWIFRILLGS